MGQVDGGDAELPATALASHDRAVDLEGPPEQQTRPFHAALEDELANLGRRAHQAAGGHLGHDGDAHAQPAAKAGQQGGVAPPIVSEAEVSAHHHVARADVLAQHLFDELLGRQSREFGGEGLDQPQPSPDGTALAYTAVRANHFELRTAGTDGRGR